MLLILSDWAFSFIFPCFQGWTVKSKTSFNKMSPVTVLGRSYLLNSEGEPCYAQLSFTFIHRRVIWGDILMRNSFLLPAACPQVKLRASAWPLCLGSGWPTGGSSPSWKVPRGPRTVAGDACCAAGRCCWHKGWWLIWCQQVRLSTNYTCKMTAAISDSCLKTRTGLTCWSCLAYLITQPKRSLSCVLHFPLGKESTGFSAQLDAPDF